MKFKAILPIKHNGKDYCIGDEIELESKDSKPLLEIKAVILLAAGQKEKGGNPSPPPPPVSEEFKKYAEKTNKLQIEYVLTLEDPKQLNSLIPYSKATAKKTIERKVKELEEAAKVEGAE